MFLKGKEKIMAVIDKDTLKAYFNNGKVPNESHYSDLIDTLFSNSIGNIIGAYNILPGLRGFWPMSSLDENGNVYDISGQNRTLTRISVRYGFSGLYPYGIYVSSGPRYLYRADENGLDITGINTVVSLNNPGLTIVSWVMTTTVAAGTAGIVSKYITSGNQRSYSFYRSTDLLAFSVSVDGITAVSATTSAGSVSANTPFFAAARFINSTSMSIFINDEKTDLLVGVPASIFPGTGSFFIGNHNNSGYWDGRISFTALYESALSDSVILALYQNSRILFQV